ncbi:MAG: hypothetical protein ACRDFC_10190 [Ignavibacteria bacterium]
MIKKLITASFLALTLFTISNSINAQTLYFCEGVDKDGYPVTESSVFNISRDGGYLYFLVRLPYEINCRSVRYEIYRDGSYDNTVYQDTERNWVYFWKEITFYKTGNYTVDVYDCYDYRLASGSVRIQFR